MWKMCLHSYRWATSVGPLEPRQLIKTRHDLMQSFRSSYVKGKVLFLKPTGFSRMHVRM